MHGDAANSATEQQEAQALLRATDAVEDGASGAGASSSAFACRFGTFPTEKAGMAIAMAIATVSIALGFSTPTSAALAPPWDVLSNIFGWVFFLSWSLSFYPQVLQNLQRGDTRGLSPDYLYLNLCGYVLYSAYNGLFFFDQRLRRKYRDANDGNDILVEVHDLIFAVHGLVLTAVQVGQCVYYNGAAQTPQPAFRLLCGGLLAVPAVWFLVAPDPSVFQVMWLSYEKLFVTIVKYMPQLVFNHRRRSTTGWSIGNILLDITGGLFSTLQLLLDAFATGDPGGILGQASKLGLGLVSIVYDLAFIAQHYVLYK